MANNKFKLLLDGQAYELERRDGLMVVNGMEFAFERKEGTVTVAGNPHVVKLSSGSAEVDGIAHAIEAQGLEEPKVTGKARRATASAAEEAGALTAVMPGLILKILKKEGDRVEVGETIIVLEAMKMQNDLQARTAGVITQMNVKQGDHVEMRQVLCIIDSAGASEGAQPAL
ncbi:MAG: biotin/lipoyl-containing protein [Holophaga sp.]|jgi:biotin carboxyl carrier protein